MRVLFFLNLLGGGGAEMHFVRMASALKAHGIEPVFATIKGGGSYESLLDDDIQHHVLKTGGGTSTIRKLAAAIHPLARLIDDLKPDIVCPVLSLTTLPAILAVRRSSHRPKIVLSIQNALGKEVFEKRSLVAFGQRLLIPRLWPKADGIIALSHGVAADIAQHVPSCANRIDVVHNCGKPMAREIEQASLVAPELPENRPVLVAVGRLIEQKDYPTMLAAMAKLTHDPAPLLWILGAGKDEAKLRELADSLSIADRVQFLGFRTDALAYMRAADLFVLSSRWEGFANVIVEAMAMGTAVIATDCPHGPSEIIADGVNGRLVAVRDSDALATAIDEMLYDPGFREKIAAAGKTRADDFGVSAITEQYASAFRSFADGAGKS